MSQVTQAVKVRRPIKTSSLWLPVLFVLATGGLLVFIIFVMLGYQVLYFDRVYPGVQVAGIDAGGMTQPELMAAVSAQTPALLTRVVTLHVGEDSWTFTGQELGMRVDVAATAAMAYTTGRSGNFLADMIAQLRLFYTPRSIDPMLLYDSGPTNQILQNLADRVYQPPQDANLIIYPDGRVEAVSARRGRQMSVNATRPLLEAAIFSPDNQPVQAVIQEIVPGITTVEPGFRQARNLLGVPLVFRFNQGSEEKEWRIEPEVLVKMIGVSKTVNGTGQTEFTVTLDPQKFKPYFEEFAAAIKRDPIEARLAFDPEKQELKVLQESRDGRTLDMAEAYRRVTDLPEQTSHLIELPVQVVPPVVSSENVESLGIKELVVEATTYFKGSSESRVRNIALAASKFHGVIVPPGGIFSFNQHLGAVTKENGFDESLIIQGNRTSVGLGGGVCQVSTTAFRAAFFGGFELVERWAHGYRVGWYETNSVPGLDATIYTPNVDFKFRNDTGYYLLVQTNTDPEEGTVTFLFYSTKTGREVMVSEPEKTNLVKHGPAIYEDDPSLPKETVKQVDWAVDGLDVTVTRTVKEGEQVIHQDKIFSHYNPWQAVYRVGTGEAAQ